MAPPLVLPDGWMLISFSALGVHTVSVGAVPASQFHKGVGPRNSVRVNLIEVGL